MEMSTLSSQHDSTTFIPLSLSTIVRRARGMCWGEVGEVGEAGSLRLVISLVAAGKDGGWFRTFCLFISPAHIQAKMSSYKCLVFFYMGGCRWWNEWAACFDLIEKKVIWYYYDLARTRYFTLFYSSISWFLWLHALYVDGCILERGS